MTYSPKGKLTEPMRPPQMPRSSNVIDPYDELYRAWREIAEFKKILDKHGVEDMTQLDNMLKTANDAMAKSLTQPESKHDRSRGLSLFRWGKREKRNG